jgi:hypothetical protein
MDHGVRALLRPTDALSQLVYARDPISDEQRILALVTKYDDVKGVAGWYAVLDTGSSFWY